MRVSVIVPAKNEEKYIENTLISIKNQNYKNIETIVVPNGCIDKTENIAREYADKVIVLNKASVNRARNIGAGNSSGEVLIFLDADTRLAKDAVSTLVASIKKKKQATNKQMVGTIKTIPDKNGARARLLALIKNTARHFKLASHVIYCEREIFEKSNGFDESLEVGKHDDGEFVRRTSKLGKFKCIDNTYALTSMRRFENQGYLKSIAYWVFFNKDKEYPEIR